MASFLNTVSTVGALVMAATPLMAVGSFAHAADVQPVRIQVADLDFSRPSDVATFGARVTRAADTLCSERGVSMSAEPACRQAVRDEAMAKLGAGQRQSIQTASVGGESWKVAGE